MLMLRHHPKSKGFILLEVGGLVRPDSCRNGGKHGERGEIRCIHYSEPGWVA